MLAGVSTACFYPDLPENAMTWLARRGVGATEVFFNAFSELEDSFLYELLSIARDAGVSILSIHPFTSGFEPLLLFSNYRRRTLDGFELYKRFFHAAALLGARWIVIHGDRREHKRPNAQYFEVFGELMEIARSMGVMVVQENVPRCNSYSPAFFAEMARALPHARFVLDTKQCLRSGYSVREVADAMGENLCHVHLSDCDEAHDCLPVGQGTMDVAGLLQYLRERNGFDGGVMQEVYRDNYRDLPELIDGYHEIVRAIHSIL